jgi:hypothetical protein
LHAAGGEAERSAYEIANIGVVFDDEDHQHRPTHERWALRTATRRAAFFAPIRRCRALRFVFICRAGRANAADAHSEESSQ